MNPGFALPYDICVNRVWVRKHLTEGRGSAPEWELAVDPFQNEVASAVVARFPQRLKPVQSVGRFTRPWKDRSSTVVRAFTVIRAFAMVQAFTVTRAITMCMRSRSVMRSRWRMGL